MKSRFLNSNIEKYKLVVWKKALKLNHKIFGLSRVPTEAVPNPWLFNWAMQTDGYSIIVDIKRNKGDGNPKKSKVKKKKEVWLLCLNK